MTDPTTSGAPGVESHVAGQDTSQAGAAGAVPGGTGLDSASGPSAPSEDVLGSRGDSVGDDDVVPQGGVTESGGVLPDADSSSTSTSASEPPD
jgi:hypothetical protein